MDAYVYKGALYCGTCTHAVTTAIIKTAKQAPSLDSDKWPQGPYGDGGGEADSPQHCDKCHVHLENPLTSEGDAYVLAALNAQEGDPAVLLTWAQHYDYLIAD